MCCKGFEPERDEPVKKTSRWHVFRARGRSGYAARPADAQAAAKSLAAHHRTVSRLGCRFCFSTIFCTGKTLQRAAVSTEPVPQERWDIQFFVIHECYNKVITMK